MITAGSTFLIDLTGFLEASQKAFLGAPCLLVAGEDQTFVFGVVRDLLQLRHTLGIGINRGMVVIGEEGDRVTTGSNIAKACAFSRNSGSRKVDLRALGFSTTRFSDPTHPARVVAEGSGG